MDKTDAVKLLSYHSCRSEDVQNIKWKNGFLGSLASFETIVYEENFIDIMECLKVLSNEFLKEKINHDLVRDVIMITHLGRDWTEKGGVLDSMGLISDEQSKQINEWVKIIENTVFNLLDGNIDKAFYKYDEYKKGITV